MLVIDPETIREMPSDNNVCTLVVRDTWERYKGYRGVGLVGV